MDQREHEDMDLDDFYEQCSMADVEIMDKSFVTKSTVLEIGCYILFLLHEIKNEDESWTESSNNPNWREFQKYVYLQILFSVDEAQMFISLW